MNTYIPNSMVVPYYIDNAIFLACQVVARVVEKARERELQYELILPVQADLLSKFRGLRFWNFNREDRRDQAIRTNNWCCFNHAIGLPMRDNKQCQLASIATGLRNDIE